MSNSRLEFIKAKYFGRDLGVPELSSYTDVKVPLDAFLEGPFPFEVNGADDEKENMFKKFSDLALSTSIKVKKKRTVARRVSMSSSESDRDIAEVLKEVVRDYTATHSRSTRPAESAAESQESSATRGKGSP